MFTNTFQVNGAISARPQAHDGAGTPHERAAPALRPLTTTVPREFVHRASIAEVMLTGWERTDDHRFTVTAQWPRRHSFFADIDGCHDPLIAAETIRQAAILLAHTEFGVPLGHHFLMTEMNVTVQPEYFRIGSTPAALELDVSCTRVEHRRNAFTGCDVHITIHRDGHRAATGGGTLTCIAPKVYQRLRAARRPDPAHPRTLPLPPPETPRTVGRHSPADVVLSPTPTPHRWHLRADTRHPVLFDHPVDHAPGMLLLEAARQATTATLKRPCLPLALTIEFTRYAELDTPCTIETQPLPTPHPHEERTLITATQEQHPVFKATITTTTPTP